MRDGLKIAAARGVTAVHDKDGWLGAPRFWQRLADEGALTLRVWQSLPHEHVDRLEELGLRSGIGDDLLRIGYLKVFMDGTLGSQTARLLDGSGVKITGREELAEIVRAGARAGWPVAVHAIGDLANREALDAFEETREEWSPLGLRQRIEHAQLLAEEDMSRFAELGVAASVQFSHAPSDRDIADRIWAGKTDRAYAYRSLVESGAVVANGSDAPIEELDPLAGIRAGVLRTLDERDAWHPEQAITIEQAIEATILAPAWLARDERRRGQARPGLPRRPRRARPRPAGDPARGATRRSGRGHDARRPLGATTRRPGTSERLTQVREGLVELFRGGSTPRAMCSTRKRSFGEWMFPSGRSKPERIVGTPFSSSADITGREPPTRSRSGRAPMTRSNASCPRRIAGSSGGTSAAGALAMSSISTSAPSGTASRMRRSISAAIALSS